MQQGESGDRITMIGRINAKYLAVGIIILLVSLVFSRDVTHQFLTFDDNRYIVDNPFVSAGLSWNSITWAFTTGHEGNWHPVTWLSHMLDVTLFGLAPGLHHAVNVLWHLGNALLLLALITLMTGRFWHAFIVAALFAVHPLHVESVAWVAERKDVLSTFFFFATLITYVHYTRRPRLLTYLLALITCSISLMAKSMAVSLPLVMLIIDLWPLGRAGVPMEWQRIRNLVAEKLPFLVLSLVTATITYHMHRTWGAAESIQHQHAVQNLGNVVVSYWHYMVSMFYPRGLAVFYPYELHLPWWKILLSTLAISGVTLIAIGTAARHPYVLAGWLWYLVTLLPVVGIVNIGYHSYADRYTYIPLTGLFLALVWLVSEVWNRRSTMWYATGWAGIILVLAACAYKQDGYWKDSFTLFSRAIRVTSDNWLAHQHLATLLFQDYKMPEALAHIQESIRINPKSANSFLVLGTIYNGMNRPREAIMATSRGLYLKPDNPKAMQLLGILYAETGRTAEAESLLAKLRRINPGDAAALERYIRAAKAIPLLK